MSLDNPDFVGAAQSALAGMPQQSQQPAQAPQPPAPVAPLPQTFFGKLIQGALNGLAGGLKQGQENVAGAGTAGFTPGGNGLAYAQQLQAKQDADRQAQAQQANQQGQQDFENQRAAFKDQQDAIMQKAQIAQTKLNGIHQAYEIHHGTQEDQDKYDTEQRAQIKDAADNGITQHEIKPEPGQHPAEAFANWLQKNPGHESSSHFNTVRDADGNISKIVVSEDDPNRQVSAADVNRGLRSVNSSMKVPDGSSMSLSDARHLYTSEGAKQADEHNKIALQNNANANSIKLANITQAGEDRRAASKGGSSDIDDIATDIVEKGQTIDQIPGTSKTKTQVIAALGRNYPNLDQSSIRITPEEIKRRDLANNARENVTDMKTSLDAKPELIGPINGRLSAARVRVGTDDPTLGKIDAAVDAYAIAAQGAHGSRAVQGKAEVKEALLNGLHNGPQAFDAAVAQMQRSLSNLADVGKPKPIDPTKDLKGNPLPPVNHTGQDGGLTNFHVNPKTNERIGWNGKAWVPAPKGQ